MSRIDAEALREFVQEAVKNGAVWGLEHTEGWALAASAEYEDAYVMPFWTSEEAAQACVTEEWGDYEVSGLPLEDFIEQWLPGMQEDGYLVGINWDTDAAGPEVEPEDLAQMLETALAELQ